LRTHIVQDLRCQLSHPVPRPGSQFILSSTRAQHLRCAYFSFGFFKKNAQDLRKWVREKDDDDLNIIKIKKNPCITAPK
jgi:hypothetical protein